MMRMTGIVTSAGAAVRVGAAVVALPKAQTAVGQFIADMVARIDSGELKPCPNCGHFDCECWDWVELMTAPPPADPHDDLSVWTNEDLPY